LFLCIVDPEERSLIECVVAVARRERAHGLVDRALHPLVNRVDAACGALGHVEIAEDHREHVLEGATKASDGIGGCIRVLVDRVCDVGVRELEQGGELEDVFLTSAVEVLLTAPADGGGGGGGAAALGEEGAAEGGGGGGAVRVEAAGGEPRQFLATVASRAGGEAVALELRPAPGAKCRRCWKVKPEAAAHAHGICARCDGVLAAEGVQLPAPQSG
jgi:hypothetical protein